MKQRSVVFFMLVVLIDSIGLGIVLPVMPKLLEHVAGVDVRLAAALGGGLSFAYAIAQFFFAPIIGSLSDQFGRRAVLLTSLAAFALDYAIMAVAPTLLLLAIGRFVSGVAGASYSAASAAVADVTPPAERAKTFGLLGMSFGVGFILGPLVGGLVGGLGTRAPFIVAAGLAAANALYGFFFVPETLAPELRRPFTFASANPIRNVTRIAHNAAIRAFLVVLLLWNLAFQALPTTWSYFTTAAFGWTSVAIGSSFAFSGVTMAIAQGALVGPVVKRVGERRAAVLGLGFGAIAYTVYALAHASFMLYIGMLCWAIGSFVSPACNAMMSARLGADRQGELQGVVASTYSLSSIVAPIAMTQLFWHVGPYAPWIASACLAAIAIPVILSADTTPELSVAPA